MKKPKRLVKKPNFLVWYLLGPLVILWYRLKIKLRRINRPKIRKRSLVIAPHRCYFDVLTLPIAIYPYRGHFVSTSYWYRRKWLGHLLDIMGCIKKDQYKSDVQAIKQMQDCFKRNERVFMYPEGQMSVDGRSQIIVPGIEKLVKKYKVNVYFVNTEGSYLIGPKWHQSLVKGRLNATTTLVVDENDIDNLSTEEIKNRIDDAFKMNYDFEWMKEHRDYKYRGKNKAEHLDRVILECPHCHKEDTLKAEGLKLYCSDCNFEVEFEKNSYFFKPNEFGIDNPGDLFDFYEEKIRKDVINNVVYEDEMKLVSYPGVDPINLPHTHVKMDNEFITFSGDGCDEIKIVLDKVINFVCTIGMSFEVPTPECTYRIYVDEKRVNHIIDYWYRIKALKERCNEGKN